MKKYAFGVDIGGTTIKIGLFETSGNLIEKWEIPTRTQENGTYILNDIAEAIAAKLAEKNISEKEIEGIGVGVPGPVGDDGTVYKCVNLGWSVFNVAIELERKTGFKVKVGNDANVAALGAGVGGGVIINEKIIPGSDGAAGEIGHLRVKERETETCGCGNHGCLEQYASATGIARVTKKYLEEHDDETVLRNTPELTAKAIFDAAKLGDEVAIKMVDETAKILAKGLSLVACVVNPQVFVIGGGMSKAGDFLILS